MATQSNAQPVEPEVEIVPGLNWDSKVHDTSSDSILPDDLTSQRNYKHLFAATARLNGKGECKAWLIKPELVDINDDVGVELGPENLNDLMHEVFDWPRVSMERDTVNKGVKFLQQFDTDYDYLAEELDDIRDRAWIVFFRSVQVEETHRRQMIGTTLVRALMQEIVKLAHLEERSVLAFTKLEKSTLQPEAWSTELPWKRRQKENQGQEMNIQMSFWESLAFERLNDGQLFAKDLDWLAWSPRARNAALLFERPSAFPIDFNSLIEGELSD